MGEVGLCEAVLENKMKNTHHLLSHNSHQGPFKDICVNPHNNCAGKNDNSRLGVRFGPMVTPFFWDSRFFCLPRLASGFCLRGSQSRVHVT